MTQLTIWVMMAGINVYLSLFKDRSLCLAIACRERRSKNNAINTNLNTANPANT